VFIPSYIQTYNSLFLFPQRPLCLCGSLNSTLDSNSVLEDRQFSTTTKLSGEVIFSLVGGTGGDKDDSDGFRGRDPNPILVVLFPYKATLKKSLRKDIIGELQELWILALGIRKSSCPAPSPDALVPKILERQSIRQEYQ
jgi:hypothetical protein